MDWRDRWVEVLDLDIKKLGSVSSTTKDLLLSTARSTEPVVSPKHL